MKRLIIIVAVISLIVGLGATNYAEAKRPIKLKFNSWLPNEKHPLYAFILKPWIEEIEKRSQGRVKISFYFANTLTSHGTSLDCIQSGVCDISGIIQAEYLDRLTLSGLGNLPVIPPSAVALSKAFKGVFDKYQGAFKKEFRGVKVLWINMVDPVHLFWTRAEPVRTLNDMRGLIIGSWGVDIPIIKVLGANPYRVTVPTVYSELEKKVIDGVAQNSAAVRPLHLDEIVRSATISGLYSGTLIHAMNLDKWNSLPPDIQKIIDEVSAPLWIKTSAIFDKAAEKTLGWLKKERPDIKLYTLPPEEKKRWHQAFKPIVGKWVKDANERGYPGSRIMDDFKKSLQETK